jgi:hypothetical protein
LEDLNSSSPLLCDTRFLDSDMIIIDVPHLLNCALDSRAENDLPVSLLG